MRTPCLISLVIALAASVSAQPSGFGGSGGTTSPAGPQLSNQPALPASLQYAYQDAMSGAAVTSPAMTLFVGAGHTLIGFVWYHNNASVSSVTTSQGDVCAVVPGSTAATSAFSQAVFYCAAVRGGTAYTATVQLSGTSTSNGIYVAEYGGVVAPDVSAHGSGPNASAIGLGSPLNPSGAGELVFSAAIVYSAHTVYTPAGNFIQHFTSRDAGGAGPYAGIADEVQSSAAAVQPVFTTDQSGVEWGLSVVAFTTQAWTSPVPYVSSSSGYINTNGQASHQSNLVNTTGASGLIVFVGTQNPWNGASVSVAGISDTAGSTWSTIAGPTLFNGATWPLVGIVYYAASPGGIVNDVVTVNLTSPAPMTMSVYAVTGHAGAPVASLINSPAAGATSTSVTSGPIYVAANSLLLQWANNETALTTTTSGFVLDRGGSDGFMWSSTGQAPGLGAYSGNYTLSSATGWQSVIVGLSPPSSTPLMNCMANPTLCPTLGIPDKYSTSGHFAGYADPTMRQDPLTGNLWMAYSWPTTASGSTQVVEIHLAKSTDGGNTWTYGGQPLYATSSNTNNVPGTVNPNSWSHEVMELYPITASDTAVCAPLSHCVVWMGIHSQYDVARGASGTGQTYSVRQVIAGCADTTGNGPACLSSVAAPQYAGGNQNNQQKDFPTSVNFDSLGGATTCGAGNWREPSFLGVPGAGAGGTLRLYLFLNCGSMTNYQQFYTDDPVHHLNQWSWTYVRPCTVKTPGCGGQPGFAVQADAANICAQLPVLKCSSLEFLTQAEVARAAGKVPGLSDGDVIVLFDLAHVSNNSGKIADGIVVTALSQVSPPAFVRDRSGNIKIFGVFLATDCSDAGTKTYNGPGTAAYDPSSNTGVVFVHKNNQCAGGEPGCDTQGGEFVYLVKTGVRP